MTTKSKRVVAAILAAAAPTAALALSTTAAQALPAGTPPAGPLTLSTATGNGTAPFNLQFGGPVSCPGDSATNGYEWNTFLISASMDPATLVFAADGSPIAAPGAFAAPLADSTGLISQKLTDITTGQITSADVSGVSFGIYPAGFIPAGSYRIGVACDQLVGPASGFTSGENQKYWSTSITVTSALGGGAGAWSFGAAPSAPAAPTVTPGNGSLSVAFGAVTATPPVTSYEAIATPPSGPAISATGSASPIVIPGLTNGTAYQVTVRATNTAGQGPASSSTPGTPNVAGQPAVGGLTAVPGTAAGSMNVYWNAPSGPAATATPLDYTLTVTGGPVTGSPFTVVTPPSAAAPQVVTGLTAGTTYTFTVQANYTAPDNGPATSVQAVPAAAQVLNQRILVTRPLGALVLTQRCGVNNALPALPAANAFPGYPLALTALAASTDQVGTSPDIDLATPGVQVDPGFVDYPFPANPVYPTECGLNLGTAKFISSGPLAGQYYTADGALNEVTVVDTRDIDAGWTIRGTMSGFVSGADTFSGNYLGWNPVVSGTSDPAQPGEYDQIVTAGSEILPGSGVQSGSGLATVGGQVLASSNPNQGLGIATLDARVRLLIPSSVNAGTYAGVLAITAV